MQSKSFGRQPVRFTGQHFTKNRSLITSMISEAGITSSDLVLDIGAGKGALTVPLSKIAEKVVAVERDVKLARRLERKFHNQSSITVLNMDFRNMPLPNQPFKVVSNIPYNITTDIFGKLMDSPRIQFSGGVIIIEKGASQRFTKKNQANPRIIGWNTLYEMEAIQKIPGHMFHPPPTVESAMVKIRPRKQMLISRKDFCHYISFVYTLLKTHGVPAKQSFRNMFTKKQVKRMMADAGISKKALIQDVTVPQWVYCFHLMQKLVPESAHPKMPDNYRKRYKIR